MAEVNISNAIKDQSDSAATEKSLQKQWTRKLAEAQKKLSQGEGALAFLPDPSNMQDLPTTLIIRPVSSGRHSESPRGLHMITLERNHKFLLSGVCFIWC